ncbi:MAG: DUF3131 domain-containing protein, partial [Gammaproteobacteria bacterium]|nr:DUF3131 domain-containing protein [Gammaproteobacteria bacterium]
MSTFKENLIQARSAIVFLIGLTLAFLIVFSLEQWNPAPAVIDNATVSQVNKTVTLDEGLTATRAHRPLTETEMEWAKIAWRYFENNYVSETGMVNSADKYPASTMWDTASYMLGLIAAQRLELVSVEAFDERMSALLKTLAAMPLFDDTLPNKSYNTESVAMVTYTNVATERGLGWSAIDVGRIMVPLNVLV